MGRGYCYEKPRIVPSVVGDDSWTAGQKLQGSALTLRYVFYDSAGLPFGTIINQYPTAGGLLSPGSGVDVTEANGQG
jgi:beta-lactam-binding protein with PASTA domain